ncbi:MAG: Response regulator receiver domain protein [Parcubacteria group bacterium GW2011_GWA2_47_7]|nr:MAG: Response regulator receiver domain protein [Parcubacteria group bacterium GW2011_GWA2_47_7]
MSKDKKILLVDDSAFMRKVLRDIFESDGYTNFIEAGNGNEAIQKINSEKPDFVFLDIIMPDVNGMDVLRGIGTGTRVIVVSAVGQKEMIEQAKSLGALDYIVKPFDRDQVLEKAKAYFDK